MEERTVSWCWSVTDSGATRLPRRISSSRRTQPSPISRMGCVMVVSGGSRYRANRMSSKPTTERSSGTRIPPPARGLHHANRHLVVETEDGGRSGLSRGQQARRRQSCRTKWRSRRWTRRVHCALPAARAPAIAPRSRSRLSGLTRGPVTTRNAPVSEAGRGGPSPLFAALALSMWTLGTPRRRLNSHPLTMGIDRCARAWFFQEPPSAVDVRGKSGRRPAFWYSICA